MLRGLRRLLRVTRLLNGNQQNFVVEIRCVLNSGDSEGFSACTISMHVPSVCMQLYVPSVCMQLYDYHQYACNFMYHQYACNFMT